MIFVRGWRKMDGDHERKSCLQSRLPNFIQTARTLLDPDHTASSP